MCLLISNSFIEKWSKFYDLQQAIILAITYQRIHQQHWASSRLEGRSMKIAQLRVHNHFNSFPWIWHNVKHPHFKDTISAHTRSVFLTWILQKSLKSGENFFETWEILFHAAQLLFPLISNDISQDMEL